MAAHPSRPTHLIARCETPGFVSLTERWQNMTLAVGKGVLDELFAIDGARRLGEVALVDVTSPVNQTGLILRLPRQQSRVIW